MPGKDRDYNLEGIIFKMLEIKPGQDAAREDIMLTLGLLNLHGIVNFMNTWAEQRDSSGSDRDSRGPGVDPMIQMLLRTLLPGAGGGPGVRGQGEDPLLQALLHMLSGPQGRGEGVRGSPSVNPDPLMGLLSSMMAPAPPEGASTGNDIPRRGPGAKAGSQEDSACGHRENTPGTMDATENPPVNKAKDPEEILKWDPRLKSSS